MIRFEYEYIPEMIEVRKHIQDCEGNHMQQVAYSTFHDSLTQICFGCRAIRSNIYKPIAPGLSNEPPTKARASPKSTK